MSPRLILLGLACLPCAVGCATYGGSLSRPPLSWLPRAAPQWPNCIAFSPDGSTLAVGHWVHGRNSGRTGSVVLYDATSLRFKHWFPIDFIVEEVTFSPDGDHLSLRGRRDRRDESSFWRSLFGPPSETAPEPHHAWLLLTGEPTQTKLPPLRMTSVLSADGRAVASAFTLKDPRQWIDIRSLADPDRHSSPQWNRLFDKEVKALALATEDGPVAFVDDAGRVRLRYLAGPGDPIALPKGEHGEIVLLAFSADGTRLVAAIDERSKFSPLVVWDVAGQQIIRELSLGIGPKDRQLVLSRDGRYLIATDSGRATVLDLQTGDRLFPNAEIRHAAFSPDGRRIALLPPHYSAQSIRVVELPGPARAGQGRPLTATNPAP